MCLQCRRPRFNLWVRKISWRTKWQPNPVFLPGELHGQKVRPKSPTQESDMTEQLTLQHTQGSTVLRLGNPEQNTQKYKFIAVSNRQDLTLRQPPSNPDSSASYDGNSLSLKSHVFSVSSLYFFPLTLKTLFEVLHNTA